MNNSKKWFGVFLIIFIGFGLAAFVSTGCGGSNNPSGPTTLTNTASNPLTPPAGAKTVSISGKLVNNTGMALPNKLVKLYYSNNGVETYTGSQFTTTGDGSYVFSGLATGVYILKVSDPDNSYFDTSILADASLNSVTDASVTMFDKVVTPAVPTANLKGILISALPKDAISTAQITADTGQATVTTAGGAFFLPNLASGTRTLTIEKFGLASTVISLEVQSTLSTNKTADRIVYNGNSFLPSGHTIDIGKITALYALHNNGMLIGTAMYYATNPDGSPNAKKYPAGGFWFELWVRGPTGPTKWGTVVTNSDGTWQKSNVPPNSDNSFEWLALATGTTPVATTDGSGNVLFTYTNPLWTDPVLTRGFRVKSGKTTVLDFDFFNPRVCKKAP